MKTLLPFQVIGRDFLADRKIGFLFDDMGLGKTLQVIEAMKKVGATNGVIVCPLSVRRTWIKVLREQIPDAFIKELISPRSIPDPNAFNVVNYDLVWKPEMIRILKSFNWAVLVLDESHYLKSTESKRMAAILGRDGLYQRAGRIWAMTGTPILNRPVELYPILRSLCPNALGEYSDFERYAFKFCSAYRTDFGLDTRGASNLPLLSAILHKFMIRRVKADVLHELPDITFEKVYLDPTDKLLALSKRDISEIASLQRALGVIKIEPTIKHLEHLLLTKGKVVVFTYHTEVADEIKKHFGAGAVKYTGSETAQEKEEAVTKFQNDKDVKVFIGQIVAAGTGLDGLQRVCDTCVFAELSYVPGQIAQAMDRIYRMGQTQGVLVQFIIAEDSQDETLVDKLTAKSRNINILLQEKKEEQFIQTICRACGAAVEMSQIVRAGKLPVCQPCKKEMECML